MEKKEKKEKKKEFVEPELVKHEEKLDELTKMHIHHNNVFGSHCGENQ